MEKCELRESSPFPVLPETAFFDVWLRNLFIISEKIACNWINLFIKYE
jgi:hypothetical protein